MSSTNSDSNLFAAAEALYMAGRWTLPWSHLNATEQDILWTNLRSALGFKPGHSTMAERNVNPPDNRGGFYDGNDRLVSVGDHVEYKFDNHRTGILNEALQDGDAFVVWDDGSHATVKWRHLAKIA